MRQRSELSAAGESLWLAQGWLHAETLETLAEVNEQCLELIREQAAAANVAPPLLAELRVEWSELDAPARRRAARCPYLLVDAGFAAAGRWTRVLARQVQDEPRMHSAGPFFTVPRAVSVMRLVVTYAWHLASSHGAAARLLLGMSAPCAELIGACTLSQINRLAESHVEWLTPRWPDRVTVWRELLMTANSGEHSALERMRIRGVQLLAAEARRAGPM
jgi:hypothetical protein